MQIAAGVDALQIFDSHGGQLAPTEFQEASGRWMREIIAQSGAASHLGVPVIVFSLGTHGNWDDLMATGASVLGIDWQFPLADARRLLPAHIAFRAILRPRCSATPRRKWSRGKRGPLLEAMRGRPGHIFNLGHGVPPNAKLEKSPLGAKKRPPSPRPNADRRAVDVESATSRFRRKRFD
jgi:uroporphyrinogen decarboxylase